MAHTAQNSIPSGFPASTRLVDGDSRAWPRVVLIVCWLVWAALLFGGFGWGWMDGAGDEQHIPRAARMWSSVMLALAGWLAIVDSGRRRATWFATLIAIGMTLGLIGDLFNADLVPIPLPDPVLGGIAAFGLGHIAYIWACIEAARRASIAWTTARTWSLLGWLAFGLVGWFVVVWLAPEQSILKWPAMPYSLLLAGTAGMATGLACENRRFALLAIGAALFLLSDLILAYRLFRGSFFMAGDAVWLTYGPGQMLIVFGAVIGRSVFPLVHDARPAPSAGE